MQSVMYVTRIAGSWLVRAIDPEGEGRAGRELAIAAVVRQREGENTTIGALLISGGTSRDALVTLLHQCPRCSRALYRPSSHTIRWRYDLRRGRAQWLTRRRLRSLRWLPLLKLLLNARSSAYSPGVTSAEVNVV